jgi:hypothetical protein
VVLAAVLAWVPIARRLIVEWIPVAFWWMWKITCGQMLYRRHIVAPRPVGTLALPGDMARLREYDDPATGAGMIHDPATATLTAVLSVTHPAFVLLDPGEQERRVASWGRVLATVCRSGRISMLQVLERTLPDSGTGLAESWAAHGSRDNTWASTTYAELIDRAGPLVNDTLPPFQSRLTCVLPHGIFAPRAMASAAGLLCCARRWRRSAPHCGRPIARRQRVSVVGRSQ